MRLKECVFNKRLLIKDRVHHPADNRQVALCACLQGGAGADGMFVLQQLRISFKGLIANISTALSAAASRAAASTTSTWIQGNTYIYTFIYIYVFIYGSECQDANNICVLILFDSHMWCLSNKNQEKLQFVIKTEIWEEINKTYIPRSGGSDVISLVIGPFLEKMIIIVQYFLCLSP